jgi:hypothetical protein
LPTKMGLYQNYPNPFNPVTTIKYDLPKDSHVSLKIFELTGREVTTLVKEKKMAGNYSITFDGGHLASGVYFYQLKSGDFMETKKMILLR